MFHSLDIQQNVIHTCNRSRGLESLFTPKGKFHVEHIRNGKLLATYDFPNGITNEGKNTIFDVMFNTGTQITTWYIGLISLSGYSALADADTLASHAGWTEFTGYSQANRVTWGSGASASQVVTNATPATFSMNATGTVKGIFIASNNTKGGTTGKLWATALFTADVPVLSGDELKITYTLNS